MEYQIEVLKYQIELSSQLFKKQQFKLRTKVRLTIFELELEIVSREARWRERKHPGQAFKLKLHIEFSSSTFKVKLEVEFSRWTSKFRCDVKR